MGRSPPLRVLCEQLCALFRLAFAAPPGRRALRLAAHINSQTHYAKGTPSPHEGAPTACKQQVSGTFHSPNRGAFHLSLAVLFTIGRQLYLALRSGLRDFTPGFTCPVLLRVPLGPTRFLVTGFSPSMTRHSNASPNFVGTTSRPYDPGRTSPPGLGSSRFVRHYSGNRISLFSSGY